MPAIEIRAEAVLVREGRLLLVSHEKGGESYWVLPGGHVSHGETLALALAREMREELALDVAVGALALVHDYIAPTRPGSSRGSRHVVNHAFRVRTSGEPKAAPQGALKAAKWVPLAELDRLDLRPPVADVLRRIANAPDAPAIYLPRT